MNDDLRRLDDTTLLRARLVLQQRLDTVGA
jgi:hypothetical protein